LRDRLVGEHVDPHLPATLDVTGHRNTGRLDLAVGEPAGLDGLDAVVAERQARAALRHALQPASLLLAVTDLARLEHGRRTRRRRGSAGSRGAGAYAARSLPLRRAGARSRGRPRRATGAPRLPRRYPRPPPRTRTPACLPPPAAAAGRRP